MPVVCNNPDRGNHWSRSTHAFGAGIPHSFLCIQKEGRPRSPHRGQPDRLHILRGGQARHLRRAELRSCEELPVARRAAVAHRGHCSHAPEREGLRLQPEVLPTGGAIRAGQPFAMGFIVESNLVGEPMGLTAAASGLEYGKRSAASALLGIRPALSPRCGGRAAVAVSAPHPLGVFADGLVARWIWGSSRAFSSASRPGGGVSLRRSAAHADAWWSAFEYGRGRKPVWIAAMGHLYADSLAVRRCSPRKTRVSSSITGSTSKRLAARGRTTRAGRDGGSAAQGR